MDDRGDDAARNRWLVLSLLRLAGVAMVLAGILMANDRIGGGEAIGYILLGLGLLGVFAVPQLLARRWRSPRE